MVPIGAVHLGLIVAIVIGCVVLWNYIFALRSAGYPVVPYEPRLPVPWGPRDVVIVAVATIAIVGLCAQIVMTAMPDAQDGVEVAVNESTDEHAEGPTTGDSAKGTAADDQAKPGEAAKAKMARKFTMIIASACGTALALAVGMAWLRSRGANAADLGVDGSHLAQDFRVGFAGFVAASIPIYLIQWTAVNFIPAEHPVTDVLQSHPSPLMLLATAISAVIVAPVTEEFFFRVVLQGWLEARFAERDLENAAWDVTSNIEPTVIPDAAETSLSPEAFAIAPRAAEETSSVTSPAARPSAMPIVLSSFIFALVHLSYGPSAIPLFFFAMVLGYLYRQTHRIWPSVITHASLNAFSTFIMVTSAP